MLFWIKGLKGFKFQLDKEKMEVIIFTDDADNEEIDRIDIYDLKNITNEVKDYMFAYVI